MNNNAKRFNLRGLILTLTVSAFAFAFFVAPILQRSQANSNDNQKGLFTRTESHDPEIPNYDIRSDRSAYQQIAGFRDSQNIAPSKVADIRDGFVAGENTLRSRVPS